MRQSILTLLRSNPEENHRPMVSSNTSLVNQISGLKPGYSENANEAFSFKLGKWLTADLKGIKIILNTPLGLLESEMTFPKSMQKSQIKSLTKIFDSTRKFSPLFPNIKKEKVRQSIHKIAGLLDVSSEELAKRVMISLHDPVFHKTYGQEPLELHSFIVSIAQSLRFKNNK